jgi:hypothetical protein
VSVDLHRQADIGVARQFLENLGLHARTSQQGAIGRAKRMEVRHAALGVPVGHSGGLQRTAAMGAAATREQVSPAGATLDR